MYQELSNSFFCLNPITPKITEMISIAGMANCQWGHEKYAQTIRPSANPLSQKKMM
jgi:hypothetical protein